MLEARSLLLPTSLAESRQSLTFQGYGGAVCFFRLAIFFKGFATREVEDCQELSFRHFDLEVVIRLKQKFVLSVASRLKRQITMYENLT